MKCPANGGRTVICGRAGAAAAGVREGVPRYSRPCSTPAPALYRRQPAAMSGNSEETTWPAAGLDRRRFPRKFISGSAHLLFPGQPPMEVHTQDVSLGGVGVISPRAMALNTACSLRFALFREGFGMDFLTAPVTVAYCVLSGREYGFLLGLEYRDLPANVVDIVKQYMLSKSGSLVLTDA